MTDVQLVELNGARALIRRKSNIPLVALAIGVRGGSNNETQQTAGLTGLMARTSIKGTAQRSAADIALAAESMGGSVSPSVGADVLDWEITVPARHFERALELLADVAFHAQFPEQEFAVEQKLALADLQQTRDDMYRYPVRMCLQQAFAGHPYGAALDDIERTLASATPEDARAWHKSRVTAQPWFFAVGDVDPELAARAIERVLPAGLNGAAVDAPVTTWQGGTQRAEPRDKAQTALALAFPGPDRNHEDLPALQVLSNAVGGLGGRFFEELRSKRSLAYTVSLLPVARQLGGAFLAYIATSPEREAEARAALLEQFERLREEPLPAADVERARRYAIGTWQIRSQTNGAQLSDLLHAFLIGPGLSEITEFEREISSVTDERILEVSRKYFDVAKVVEGVVRGSGGGR